ncbi:E3 ubiquitin-protein ligase RNF19A-like [Oopsacas minuta]|uniref:E3 ubiquitin-protein ligase RNF19A-like n=1 Tax=Oopsacas minuta TaxID=111878 RepID=A0AAV7KMX0_9METZ|nr:E3 ubiquitin-protein ligase RNF19A-like [Oopsacas minuta]
MSSLAASKSAFDNRGIEVSQVRVGADYFIGKRNYERTVKFPHPNGECCICSDEGGLKLKCGHYVCPVDILDNTWQQIKTLKHEISCASCTKMVDIDDIIILGLPNDEEKQFLNAALSVNFCASQDIQQCIRCKSYCQRKNEDSPQVNCLVCTKNMSKPYLFCWYCLGEWKSSPTEGKNCGNSNCKKEKIIQLKSAPMINFKDKKGKTAKVPRIRACPDCTTILEHNGGCNEMTCDYCKSKFSFICLTPTTRGSLICKSTTWNPNATITCVPAPIQANV